jgi:hypothetical protein
MQSDIALLLLGVGGVVSSLMVVRMEKDLMGQFTLAVVGQ